MTWLILGARSVDDVRPIVRTLRTFFGKTAEDSMDEDREESNEENEVDVLDEEMDEGEEEEGEEEETEESEESEEDARWTHGKITAWVSALFALRLFAYFWVGSDYIRADSAVHRTDKNHAATPAFEDGESEETISFEETGEEREGACSASSSHQCHLNARENDILLQDLTMHIGALRRHSPRLVTTFMQIKTSNIHGFPSTFS